MVAREGLPGQGRGYSVSPTDPPDLGAAQAGSGVEQEGVEQEDPPGRMLARRAGERALFPSLSFSLTAHAHFQRRPGWRSGTPNWASGRALGKEAVPAPPEDTQFSL